MHMEKWMFRPNFLDGVTKMAASVARRLIAEERMVRGIKRPEARRIVAYEAGLTPGSLENLERGRLKNVDRVAAKLHALLARKIERRIASLQHELFLAQQASRVGSIDLERAEAALEEAKRALGK